MSEEVCKCSKIHVSGKLTHCSECNKIFLTEISKFCSTCSIKKGTCVYCGKKKKTNKTKRSE